MALDHGDPGDAPSVPTPLGECEPARRMSAAEEARTVAASTNSGTLASLTAEGDPWASYITYGLVGGSPVLCVSNMAEHGRNLDHDPRASLSVVSPASVTDPLARSRITLAGVVERPSDDEITAARQAHLSAVPAAKYYMDYSDFSVWILRVDRVRWVGGYGRMDSALGEDYASATADPVATQAAGALTHLNEDHSESLLAMARAIGGYPDATASAVMSADRYGLDLAVLTPRGKATARVAYAEPITSVSGLRAATVELAQRARAR